MAPMASESLASAFRSVKRAGRKDALLRPLRATLSPRSIHWNPNRGRYVFQKTLLAGIAHEHSATSFRCSQELRLSLSAPVWDSSIRSDPIRYWATGKPKIAESQGITAAQPNESSAEPNFSYRSVYPFRACDIRAEPNYSESGRALPAKVLFSYKTSELRMLELIVKMQSADGMRLSKPGI